MTQDLNHKAVDKIPFSRWATGCIGAGGGIVLIFFFGQNAWASMLENEPRAAIVYLAFALLLILGVIITYISRRFEG